MSLTWGRLRGLFALWLLRLARRVAPLPVVNRPDKSETWEYLRCGHTDHPWIDKRPHRGAAGHYGRDAFVQSWVDYDVQRNLTVRGIYGEPL